MAELDDPLADPDAPRDASRDPLDARELPSPKPLQNTLERLPEIDPGTPRSAAGIPATNVFGRRVLRDPVELGRMRPVRRENGSTGVARPRTRLNPSDPHDPGQAWWEA